MDQLRVYFGIRSPYSRLGLHKVAKAGLADRIDLKVMPFTAPAGGAPFFDPMQSPPKLAYYMEDAPRMAARLGLPVKLPNPFEVSYSRANKAFFAADREGKGLEFALAVSDARWGQGKNISDLEVLADCAAACGLSRDLPKQAKSDETLSPLIGAAKHHAEEDMVFGVPFAVLERDGKKEKFWGQDRFDLLVEALA